MEVLAGVIIRTGNTDVREFNVQADFKRRTIRNRIALDFVLNENTTEGVEVSSNQRVSTHWDTLVSDRFFVTPFLVSTFAIRSRTSELDTRSVSVSAFS